MKFCPQCGTQLDDAAVVCTNCGANLAAPQQPMYAAPVAPVIPDYDHTAEYSAQEISEGKVFGLAVYLLGFMGVLVALLGCRDNKYAQFHIRTWLKFEVCTVICAIACIIPILGWIAFGVAVIIIFVLKIICFFNVCNGKAIDPAIIRGLGFLN